MELRSRSINKQSLLLTSHDTRVERAVTLSILKVNSSSLFPSIYRGLFKDVKKWMYHSSAAMVSSTITPPFLYTDTFTPCSRSTLRPASVPFNSCHLDLKPSFKCYKGFCISSYGSVPETRRSQNGYLPSFKAAVRGQV